MTTTDQAEGERPGTLGLMLLHTSYVTLLMHTMRAAFKAGQAEMIRPRVLPLLAALLLAGAPTAFSALGSGGIYLA